MRELVTDRVICPVPYTDGRSANRVKLTVLCYQQASGFESQFPAAGRDQSILLDKLFHGLLDGQSMSQDVNDELPSMLPARRRCSHSKQLS